MKGDSEYKIKLLILSCSLRFWFGEKGAETMIYGLRRNFFSFLHVGRVAVNRGMETNLQGCFAAVDCTGRPYQYVKAVGEGNVAAHSANAYTAAFSKEG